MYLRVRNLEVSYMVNGKEVRGDVIYGKVHNVLADLKNRERLRYEYSLDTAALCIKLKIEIRDCGGETNRRTAARIESHGLYGLALPPSLALPHGSDY